MILQSVYKVRYYNLECSMPPYGGAAGAEEPHKQTCARTHKRLGQ
jgi:hypothetical protein